MTREEAISYFKRHIDLYCVTGICREAEEMAIQALEQVTSYEQTINKLTKAISEQEPCEDAISRRAVRHILNHEVKMPIKVWKKLFNLVDDLPSVNPQEKTGHWISHYDEDAKEGWYECDRCNTERAFNTDYCPDCGARMIEPQERKKYDI